MERKKQQVQTAAHVETTLLSLWVSALVLLLIIILNNIIKIPFKLCYTFTL